MKLDRYRKYVRAGVTAFLVLAASMIFYYLLFHQTSVRTAFHNVLNILSPLIAALILAYVISPIINFIEQRISGSSPDSLPGTEKHSRYAAKSLCGRF